LFFIGVTFILHIFLIVNQDKLYAFGMFHILLSDDSLRDLWNVYMYVCTTHSCTATNLSFI